MSCKMMNTTTTRVCVTGGGGFLASSLIKTLLLRGYTVHATLRNLGDQEKVGLLKRIPNADTKLKLFEADIYDPDQFGKAIQGCEFVFHLATPYQHNKQNSQFKDTSEAAVGAVKSIIRSCIQSGTVKKLIYTASVVAASPLKDDGTGYKNSMDEFCWTPFNLSYAYTNESLDDYVYSKTLAEIEVLSNNKELEVVTLACGLVGGDTFLPLMPESPKDIVSQIIDYPFGYQALRFLEELLGKIPLVHIDDVIDAHIFSMGNDSLTGRFLCVSDYVSSAEIASYWRKIRPQINVLEGLKEDNKREISWGSTKLEDVGFEYKHDLRTILEDSLKCAKRMGYL